MNQQIEIEETSTEYDVTSSYHSALMCQNYDAKILAIEESDGRITLKPNNSGWGNAFVFAHSDPDRVIAIANMMKTFAEMAKKNSQKGIDISNNMS